MSEPRVLLVHNSVTPYRLPVFEALSDRVDLDVVFCEEREAERRWSSAIDADIDATVLDPVKVGPLVANPDLLGRLLTTDYDAYVLDGYDPYFPTALLCLAVARLRGTATVLWSEHVDSHLWQWEFARAGLPSKAYLLWISVFLGTYQPWLYRQVDSVAAFSRQAARYCRRRGTSEDAIVTAMQCMPASLLPDPAPAGDLDAVDPEAVTYLSLGYLRGGKGNDTLLSAYEDVATPETQLLLAGEGEAEADLREQAAGREDVHFLGHVDGPEKAGYYAAADAFVLPTRHDAWGLVTNEAMYYGTPVVTTDAAGSAWLVEEADCGLVVPPDDPAELADALETLRDDTDLRERMGERGREYEAAFDPETMADPLVTAVERALDRR